MTNPLLIIPLRKAWSDAAREAALEARRNGHTPPNVPEGTARKIANHLEKHYGLDRKGETKVYHPRNTDWATTHGNMHPEMARHLSQDLVRQGWNHRGTPLGNSIEHRFVPSNSWGSKAITINQPNNRDEPHQVRVIAPVKYRH